MRILLADDHALVLAGISFALTDRKAAAEMEDTAPLEAKHTA